MNILLLLFIIFFKVGVFTVGSGYSMLPLLQHEIVDKQKWMTDSEFTEYVAISEVTPGPIMINLATFIGFKKANLPGAIVSILGVILFPSIFILILTNLLIKYKDLPSVKGVIYFIKPVAIGLIATSIIKLGTVTFNNFKSMLITIITLVLVFYLKINPVYVVLSAVLLGLLFHKHV
ncbi:MAG: chromate transporter [bacterium]|nr:chromate transporter [bacterium]